MYSIIVAKQRLDKERYHGSHYTLNNRMIVGCVVFYALRVVSNESSLLLLPRMPCFNVYSVESVRSCCKVVVYTVTINIYGLRDVWNIRFMMR
jgi:hypothetical protein